MTGMNASLVDTRREFAGRLLALPDASLATYTAFNGPLPLDRAPQLMDEVEAAGVLGRGGAAFPTAVKLRAVAAGHRPVVIANGCEGEPASHKDAVLLRRNPHLVLDGLQLVAAAVGSADVYVAVTDPGAERVLHTALAERTGDPHRVQVSRVPDRFVAGEETAVVDAIRGGAGLPWTASPRVCVRGAFGRPTLVQNVETLAHVAEVMRGGAGTSALVTVTGAVRRPGVVELDRGTPVDVALACAGGASEPLQALLVGGYHGTWIPWDTSDPVGARPGAGVVFALPRTACGVQETARVVRYLAGESTRRCGPCLNGLPALAAAMDDLAAGRLAGRLGRVEILMGLVEGRGACHHPDGTTRFVRSALDVFGAEIARHAQGHCAAPDALPLLPVRKAYPR